MHPRIVRSAAALGAALALGLAPPAPADSALPSELPFRPVVDANGVLYVSGHLPLLPGTRTLDGDTIGPQTHRVLENISATLDAAGATMRDIVRVTVYLTTMEDFAAFNAAYLQHFSPPYPARTTVAVCELAFESRIEVSCIAVRPASVPAPH